MNNEATKFIKKFNFKACEFGFLKQNQVSNDQIMIELDFECEQSFDDIFYIFSDDSFISRAGDEYIVGKDFYEILDGS